MHLIEQTFCLYSETGSEESPCSGIYRGSRPFSEVEIINVANFLKSKDNRLVGYLDIHSYSQLWMIPWGYTKEATEDNKELVSIPYGSVHTHTHARARTNTPDSGQSTALSGLPGFVSLFSDACGQSSS